MQSDPRVRRPFALFSLAIAGAVFILYSVSLGHNFLFDEANIILRNPYIKSLSSIGDLFTHAFFYLSGEFKPTFIEYYRPLTSLTFAVDFHFWKANPMGYNLTNVLLHGAVSVLLLRLLLQIIKNKWAALVAALFYAVHTAHSELLRDVSGRGEILGGLFLLLSMLAYSRSRVPLSCLCYTAALLSKESALLIPVYLLAYDCLVTRSGWRGSLKRLRPLAAVAAAYLLFRKYLCPVPLAIPDDSLRSMLLRILSMGPAFVDYLKALVWPEPFKFFGSIDFAMNFKDPAIGVTLAVGAALTAVWAVVWKRGGTAAFGLTFFLAGFLPFLQFTHFYPEWAEHFLYVPAMGFSVLAAAALEKVMACRNRFWKLGMPALALLLILFISSRTYGRNTLTNDLEKFYTRLSQSSSTYAMAGFHELALMRIRKEKYDEAIAVLEEALAKTHYNTDVTYQMLGACYSQKGDLEKSLENLRKASAQNPANDRYKIDIGKTLVRIGRYDEAIAVYSEVQQSIPGYYLTYRLLMEVYELAGQPEKALEWGRKGLMATTDQKQQHAALNLSILRFAYRNGWQKLLEQKLETLLKDFPDVPWQGDIARLLSGRTPAQDFLRNVLPRYPGFEEEAKLYILMSYVLQKDCKSLTAYLRENKDTFDRRLHQDLFFEKDFEKAKQIC